MKKKALILPSLIAVGIGIAVIAVQLYSTPKIQPGVVPADGDIVHPTAPPGSRATIETVTEWYRAVGTVRPRTEARIESQVTARILDVKVSPGDSVLQDQPLISLDNRQLTARLDQSRQGLKAAEAGEKQANEAVNAARAHFNRTQLALERTRKYVAAEAATARDLEEAEAIFLQARAELQRAREGLVAARAAVRQAEEVVNEADIALGYATIKAPEDGEILKRLVEPGDLALPGKPLLSMQTAGTLRLEAYVREGIIGKVRPEMTLNVEITTLNRSVRATVDEIVPYADPQTRTFLVKASLPAVEGLYPGMFGKLLIPIAEHQVVLIPDEAINRVGQLEQVLVQENGTWKTRLIKTGRRHGNRIEVLSGLSGNEIIALNPGH